MKSILTVSSLLFLLASCTNIYFQEVQPKGGVYQSEMPKELFGVWLGENEGWQINERGITNIDYEIDSLGNVVDTTYETTPLNDSLRFYRAKNIYILNSKENSDYWEIVVFQPMENGDINVYFNSDPKKYAGIKGLKLEEANFYIDDEYRNVKTLDPEAETSLIFESAVFSGQMKINSLKKALGSMSPTILKNDGTFHVVENDSI